ncbi:MAG: hypothetical protein QXU12_06270 [Nitrososphaerota archaeon]
MEFYWIISPYLKYFQGIIVEPGKDLRIEDRVSMRGRDRGMTQ